MTMGRGHAGLLIGTCVTPQSRPSQPVAPVATLVLSRVITGEPPKQTRRVTPGNPWARVGPDHRPSVTDRGKPPNYAVARLG